MARELDGGHFNEHTVSSSKYKRKRHGKRVKIIRMRHEMEDRITDLYRFIYRHLSHRLIGFYSTIHIHSGLVEIIVLNLGLDAKVIDVEQFTTFVLMALVTTFATTPGTSAALSPRFSISLLSSVSEVYVLF
jgi:hypothetical protein